MAHLIPGERMMIELEAADTIHLIANMDCRELCGFYWKIADRRAEITNREEREYLRNLLLVIDAVGELQYPALWHEKRHAI